MNNQILFERARKATRDIIHLEDKQVAGILSSLADATVESTSYLLEENKKDLDRMDPDDPKL